MKTDTNLGFLQIDNDSTLEVIQPNFLKLNPRSSA